MNEHLRQTGRTTRLIEKAIKLGSRGFQVTILVWNRKHMPEVERLIQALVLGTSCNINRIGVAPVPEHFSWAHMCPAEQVNRSRDGRIWLADHFAVEHELQKVDEEIMRLQQLQRQLYQLTV